MSGRPPARDHPERAPTDDARQRVLAIVDSIPRGRVASYGQVAAEAGLPRRARWVGRVLSELGPESELPWHRVVAADGSISRRPGRGPSVQRARLCDEGVALTGRGRIELARFGWSPDWGGA